jgi:hypothetical protein
MGLPSEISSHASARLLLKFRLLLLFLCFSFAKPALVEASDSSIRNKYNTYFQAYVIAFFSNPRQSVLGNQGDIRKVADFFSEDLDQWPVFYDLMVFDFYSDARVKEAFERDPVEFNFRLEKIMEAFNNLNEKIEQDRRDSFYDPTRWLVGAGIGASIAVLTVPLILARSKDFKFDRRLVKRTSQWALVGGVCGLALAGLSHQVLAPRSVSIQKPSDIREALESPEDRLPAHLRKWREDPSFSEVLRRSP